MACHRVPRVLWPFGLRPVTATRWLMAFSRRSGSMFHESGSESTNTGVPPRYVTRWLEAQNVNDCTSTVAGPTPHTAEARWTAAVPALRHATCLVERGGAVFAAVDECRQLVLEGVHVRPHRHDPVRESKASFMKSISRPLACRLRQR